jgi:hypothetical protein
MRNPWADEFEHTHVSRACVRGAHDDCPHFCGVDGGLNPRRLRLEFGAALCKCGCHSACPITGNSMPFRSGPGARRVPARARSRNAPGRLRLARSARTSGSTWSSASGTLARATRHSTHTVRAEAAGRSHEEIRNLYVAELRARGLDIPPDECLDATVDAITGDYRSSVRLLGRALADIGKLFAVVFRPSRD